MLCVKQTGTVTVMELVLHMCVCVLGVFLNVVTVT